MGAAARPEARTARVVAVADGLVELLTERGRVRAGLGGALLARVAADPGRRPRPGDRVALAWWPDGPVTVERVLGVDVALPDRSTVVPLHQALPTA